MTIEINYESTDFYRTELAFETDADKRKIMEYVIFRNSHKNRCICCPADADTHCRNGHGLCEDCAEHACIGCALLA